MAEIFGTFIKWMEQLPDTFVHLILALMVAWLIRENTLTREREKAMKDLMLEKLEEIKTMIFVVDAKVDKNMMETEERDIELEKMILRSVIVNDNLSLKYRRESLEKYKELEGNSWVVDYAEQQMFNEDEENK